MAEYIEREAVMLEIDAADFVIDANFEGGATLLYCDDVVDRLSAIPAADVRENKRGKWEGKWYCSNMSGYEYAMNCSECGKPTYRASLSEKMPNFCPNCGADMREEQT